MPRGLTPKLAELKETIEGYARSYGLDFFETVFEQVTYDELNMVAAYGGFPNRYPHWRWGMEYEQLSKGYEYGLSKIYELVINNDPNRLPLPLHPSEPRPTARRRGREEQRAGGGLPGRSRVHARLRKSHRVP
jgi:hypothetical protein